MTIAVQEDENVHKAKESNNFFIKILWIFLGSIFVALAALGVALPGLPTTPFLILAAACYIRSSQKLYDWLISNKTFGPYLKDYREGKGIPKKAKILAISMIVLFVGSSVIFGIENLNLKIAVGVLGLTGLLYVIFKVPVAKD
jgi:hypothetical protein|tara:strand:+ start:146 stop:574 length:429 start_codon:yes stop_codon:yes gene_type:complete